MGDVKQRVARWVDDMVVGLDLCPFAKPVVEANRLRIEVSDASNETDAAMAVMGAASHLIGVSALETSTTLVVLPRATPSFVSFLDLIEIVESLLQESGADELLQLAHFHPHYLFEGEDPDGVSHYTNRSPYPIVHILRRHELEAAIKGHPDPLSIPTRNIEVLEGLGLETIKKRLGDPDRPTSD